MTACLTSFKYFDSFNLLLFSRSKDLQTHFLLRKKLKASDNFTHFQGSFNNQEPSILLSLAKKFVRKTEGLLCSQNFKYFILEGAQSLSPDSILIEKCPKATKPSKTLTPALDDICKLVCESSYFFQDSSNTATYFVEIPMLDLQKLKDFTASKDMAHQFKYFTIGELLTQTSQEIDPRIQEMLQGNFDLMKYVQKYIIDNEPIKITGSYGIICCEMFLTTHLLHALHFPTFKKHGESWRFYKAYEKDLPTEEELKKIKGIIIPGSSLSAYNPHIDWYEGLFELIRGIHNQYKHINLLGICFGAQIIAQALGGRVEKMDKEFITGGEILKVAPEFYELPYVKNCRLDSAKQLVIAQAHSDHIVELPPIAKLYVSSENTNVEVFTIGKNILAFQGHPDYNEIMVARSYLKNKNVNLRNYAKNEEACIKSKFPVSLTQQEVLKVCFGFLKQNLMKVHPLCLSKEEKSFSKLHIH